MTEVLKTSASPCPPPPPPLATLLQEVHHRLLHPTCRCYSERAKLDQEPNVNMNNKYKGCQPATEGELTQKETQKDSKHTMMTVDNIFTSFPIVAI